jgi:hypothetical protein
VRDVLGDTKKDMRFLNSFAVRIYLIALVLRLIPVLLMRGLGIGLDDMFQYDMLARSISSGNGYRWYAREDLRQLEPYVDFDFSSVEYDPVRGVPTSFRAPLYPAFLASVYAISGAGFGRFFAARIAQVILLSAPLAPLTYDTARQLLGHPPRKKGTADEDSQRERAARLAAWFVTLYPILLIFPLGLGTENLFFLLVLGSFLSLLKALQQPSPFRFLLAGFLLGLAALTRSVILPFAILAIVWVWLMPLLDNLIAKKRGSITPHRRGIQGGQNVILRGLRVFAVGNPRGAFLVAFALLLTVLPWVVRNSFLHGRLTGIETSLGYNLYVGYHPQSVGTFTFGPSLDLVSILDDSLRDQVGTQRALEFIKADPGRFFSLLISRLGHFFRLELRVLTYFYSSNFFGYLPAPLLLTLAGVFGLPFAILCLSAAFGAVLLRIDRGSLLLLLLFLGYLTPHIFILSEERFHLALVPFLAILAAHFRALGLPAVFARFHASRAGRVAVTLACIVSISLVVGWGYQLTSEADKVALLLGPEGNTTYFPY